MIPFFGKSPRIVGLQRMMMENDKVKKRMLPVVLATLLTALLCTVVVQALMILSAMRENPETFAQDFDWKGIAITLPFNFLTQCIVVLLIVMIHKRLLSFCTNMFSKEKRDQRVIDKFKKEAQQD